ncbi:MAG: hypothetical protein J7M25_18830 [Deltaproteobacteria bacterium]|nr:hypothetical protein [Deltaproteobacteria bacterium]
MRKAIIPSILATLLLVGLPACSKGKTGGNKQNTKEIEIAVKEDTKLATSQDDLLRKRGAIIRLRKQIHEQRSALEKKKLELKKKDPKAAAALSAQEQALDKKEKNLFGQEQALTTHLNDLLKKRAALLTKANAALSASVPGTPTTARREHAVALRELALAKREKSVALREAALAKREASIATRERQLAKGCAGFAPSIVMPKITMPSGPSTPRYTQRDVKAVYSRALHTFSSKGILSADLPSPILKIKSNVRSFLAKKEYFRAKYAADQLLAIARAMKINRGFVAAKVARLNRAIGRKHLNANRQRKVNNLLRQATTAYGDGNFRRANSRLNRIYSLLH